MENCEPTTKNYQGVDIPMRYVVGMDGDMDEALRRWQITEQWRKDYKVDGMLEEPQPHLDVIKKYYPHGVHKRGRAGHLCYFERIGDIDLPALRAEGVTMEALLRHYIFITEFLWKVLDTRENDGKLFTVMDMKGVGMRDLAGEAVEFIRTASGLISAHYVERSYKIFVLNAPWWFNMVWAIVSPIMHAKTRAKVVVKGSDYKEALLEHIAPEDLPEYWGGTDTEALGESPAEVALRELAERMTKAAEDADHNLTANGATAAPYSNDQESVQESSVSVDDVKVSANLTDTDQSSDVPESSLEASISASTEAAIESLQSA